MISHFLILEHFTIKNKIKMLLLILLLKKLKKKHIGQSYSLNVFLKKKLINTGKE